MSRIASVCPALPENVYAQDEITATIAPLLTGEGTPERRTLERMHAASGVASRHLALPLDRYPGLRAFGTANDAFLEVGTALAARATKEALDAAGIRPDEVDLLLFTTVTGVSAPSLDALLAPQVGLRPDVRRTPMFGLGCAAGAAGLGQAHDYLAGHPEHVVLLVSVELCSLTIQHGDDSTANLVSSGLFGDGATAVVLVGDSRPAPAHAPRVLGTASHLYPDTTGMLGWDVGGTGFAIVLGAGLAGVVETHLGPDVRGLLARHDLGVDDVDVWLAHPGGPRILEASAHSLGLDPARLDVSRRVLAREGNVSSSAVLHVLAEAAPDAPPGAVGVLFAFGPGVCGESVLLRWPEGAA